MVISFFINDNQRKFIFYPLLITIILVFSLRGSPDEYTRYMLLNTKNAYQIIEGFPLSETVFKFIGFLSLKSPFPRFSIYFITYSLTFFALFKGLDLYKKGLLSKVLPICFFLSHNFLSFNYVSIRGGLANALAFWAISYLFTRDNFKGYLYVGIISFFVHIQSIFTLSVGLIIFFFKDFIFLRIGKKLIPFLIVLGIISYNLRTNLEDLIIRIAGGYDDLFIKYFYYAKSESYGYDINLLDSKILLAISLQVIIFLIYNYLIKDKNNSYSYCSIIILIYPLIIIFFSNIAIMAFRLASGLLLFNLPIIGSFSSQIKSLSSIKSGKIPFSLILITALSTILITYNLFVAQRFHDFSFTEIDYVLPK